MNFLLPAHDENVDVMRPHGFIPSTAQRRAGQRLPPAESSGAFVTSGTVLFAEPIPGDERQKTEKKRMKKKNNKKQRRGACKKKEKDTLKRGGKMLPIES